jgi:hypothetical protein
MATAALKKYQTALETSPFIPNPVFYKQITEEIDKPDGQHPYLHGVTQRLFDLYVQGDGHDPPAVWKKAKEKVARKLSFFKGFDEVHEHIGKKANFYARMGFGNSVYCWNRAEESVASECLISPIIFEVVEE